MAPAIGSVPLVIAPGRWAGSWLLVGLAACSGGGSTDGSTAPDLAPAVSPSTGPALERVPGDSAAVTSTVTGAESTTTSEAPRPLAIAVVAPSPADDGSFTQGMVEGLGQLTVAADVDLRAEVGIDEVETALQSAIDRDPDLVIVHGTEFGAAVRDAATANPETSFAWGPGGETFGLANVFAYDARADQGGYVLGAMAAAGSRSGVIGIVGSVEVADGRRYVEGFTAGAEAQRPGIAVERTYTDSFDDQQLAAEAARRLVDRGADALTSTQRLAPGTTAVAVERGVPWFASETVPSSSAPAVQVAAQVYHWEVVVGALLERVGAGVAGGEVFELTLANGGLEIVYDEAAPPDPAARAAADTALAALLDGSLLTGVD